MSSENSRNYSFKKTIVTTKTEKTYNSMTSVITTSSTVKPHRKSTGSMPSSSSSRFASTSAGFTSPTSSSSSFVSATSSTTRPTLKPSYSHPVFPNNLNRISENNSCDKKNPFIKEFGTNVTDAKTFLTSQHEYKSPYSGNAFKTNSEQQSTSSGLNSHQTPKPGTSTSSFSSKIKDMSEKLFKKSPGICYIFNHQTFNPSLKLEYRIGSEYDVETLKKTFKDFNVNVQKPFNNLTLNEIRKTMKILEKKDFSKISCIIIVILSHGDRLELIAAKDGAYSIDDDILFPLLNNPSLNLIPKIFIIQACKGDIDPRFYIMTDSHSQNRKLLGTPSEIIKCYSTYEGFVSYRHTNGSTFIQTFCELLKKDGKDKDIREIMNNVIKRVAKESRNRQIPSFYTSLTKPYIFGEHM